MKSPLTMFALAIGAAAAWWLTRGLDAVERDDEFDRTRTFDPRDTLTPRSDR